MVLELAHTQAGECVLDLGSGDGAFTYALYRRGAVCTGVEPDEVGRSIAEAMFQKNGAAATFVDSITQVPTGTQDLVVCCEVIEHVHDPAHLLDQAKRVLKPNGRIILSTPVRLTQAAVDSEHVREYFPCEFKAMASEHFRVLRHVLTFPVFGVELYYWRPWFFFRLPVTKWFMNVLSAWFGICLMGSIDPLARYYTLQLIEAIKQG
jgi:SAM-dependent methyltransferase